MYKGFLVSLLFNYLCRAHANRSCATLQPDPNQTKRNEKVLSQDNRLMPNSAIIIQIAVCLTWALGHVAVKSISDQISPTFHAGVRSLGATILLIAWIQYKRIPVWGADGTLVLGITAGVLFGIEFILLFIGITMTTAARGTLLIYSAPFFVALGAHFFVPNDKLNRNKVLGLSLAFGGLTLVFWEGITQATTIAASHNPNLSGAVTSGLSGGLSSGLIGDLLCLSAAAMWGATTVLVKASKLKNCPPEKNLLYQLGVSVPVLLGAAWLLGESGVIRLTGQLVAVLVFGIVIVASTSFLIWFWLVSRYRATTLHAFTFLTPLFAVVLSALLLKESISGFLIAGSILIAAGIVLVNRAVTTGPKQ